MAKGKKQDKKVKPGKQEKEAKTDAQALLSEAEMIIPDVQARETGYASCTGDTGKKWLCVREVSELINESVSNVYRKISTGEIRASSFGPVKGFRIAKEEVEGYLKQLK